jgi:cytidine deaminase
MIIVDLCGGYIISVFYEPNKYSIHAEVACLMNCKRKSLIPKATMYIIKLATKELTKQCMPCDSCKKFIKKYKVRRIICS